MGAVDRAQIEGGSCVRWSGHDWGGGADRERIGEGEEGKHGETEQGGKDEAEAAHVLKGMHYLRRRKRASRNVGWPTLKKRKLAFREEYRLSAAVVREQR